MQASWKILQNIPANSFFRTGFHLADIPFDMKFRSLIDSSFNRKRQMNLNIFFPAIQVIGKNQAVSLLASIFIFEFRGKGSRSISRQNQHNDRCQKNPSAPSWKMENNVWQTLKVPQHFMEMRRGKLLNFAFIFHFQPRNPRRVRQDHFLISFLFNHLKSKKRNQIKEM